MKKNKGFTLVELLAVIVILAIILVIAVPQIMSTIDSARLASMESSAKMVAASAEREYTVRETLGQSTASITCADVATLSSTDYETTDAYTGCKIYFNNGAATVYLNGKTGGKFAGKHVCGATRTTATANITDCTEPT